MITLAGLLWMVMAWTQAQTIPCPTGSMEMAHCGCPDGYINSQNFLVIDGRMQPQDDEHCEKVKQPPPFDVPAAKKDGPNYIWSGKDWVRERVNTCADESRFLLMSEDGRWHCLALGKQP